MKNNLAPRKRSRAKRAHTMSVVYVEKQNKKKSHEVLNSPKSPHWQQWEAPCKHYGARLNTRQSVCMSREVRKRGKQPLRLLFGANGVQILSDVSILKTRKRTLVATLKYHYGSGTKGKRANLSVMRNRKTINEPVTGIVNIDYTPVSRRLLTTKGACEWDQARVLRARL